MKRFTCHYRLVSDKRGRYESANATSQSTALSKGRINGSSSSLVLLSKRIFNNQKLTTPYVSDPMTVTICVDDIIVTRNNLKEIEGIKLFLKNQIQTKESWTIKIFSRHLKSLKMSVIW